MQQRMLRKRKGQHNGLFFKGNCSPLQRLIGKCQIFLDINTACQIYATFYLHLIGEILNRNFLKFYLSDEY